jgi:hypothetical protein
MDSKHGLIYQAFQEPVRIFARVTPQGFMIGSGDAIPALEGRVSELGLRRKRFEDGSLRCHSLDGVRSRTGIACDLCRHPDCRPQLRIHLADGSLLYILDLGWTSAKNLIAVIQELEAAGERLVDWPLRLTVIPQQHWGEVRFEKLP